MHIESAYLSVDEAGLITGQEEHGLSLLNGLSESSSWEVNLSPQTLWLVISEPILQERSVERSRAERVEPETLSRVYNGQLSRQSQYSALASCVSQLRCGGSDQGNDGSSVNDGSPLLLELAQRQNGVLAAKPHALDVNGLGQVPDLLGCVNGVGVIGVHYASVVEHDINTTPGVYVSDQSFNVGFLGHVCYERIYFVE